SSKRTHRVAGKRFSPARPAHFEDAEGAFQQKYEYDERELPDLDSNIERQQCNRQFRLGQSGAGESAGKAKAVKQSKRKRHNPRMPNAEAGFAAPRAHDLRAEEEDAEPNDHDEREHGSLGVAEGRNRERDAMRDGEGRN